VLKEKRRSLRIGYSFFNGAFEAVPVMRRAVAEAKTLLEASGHQVMLHLKLPVVLGSHWTCVVSYVVTSSIT